MEVLWAQGLLSVREIFEGLPRKGRPSYSTVQTTVYRLERKGALRVAKRVGNANVVEAVIARSVAHTTLVDELLDLFGGRMQPLMTHLIETGRLTLDDVRVAEKHLRDVLKNDKKP